MHTVKAAFLPDLMSGVHDSTAKWVLTMCRFREGSDGGLMGPPEIISEHVPVPLERPPGGLRGQGGGFGRSALGPLPDDYPLPASRLVLKDIRACIQLCTDADNAGASMNPVCNIAGKMPSHIRVLLDGTGTLETLATHPLHWNLHYRESKHQGASDEARDDVCGPIQDGAADANCTS